MKCSQTTQHATVTPTAGYRQTFYPVPFCHVLSHTHINFQIFFVMQKETLVFPERKSGSKRINHAGMRGSAKWIKGTRGPPEHGEQQRSYHKSVSSELSLFSLMRWHLDFPSCLLPTITFYEQNKKVVWLATGEKYNHLYYPSEKRSLASSERLQKKEENIVRGLSCLWVPRDPLRKTNPM